MLATKIRAKMVEKGVSAAKMAKSLKITTRSWSRLLEDAESRITVGRLRVIAAVLGERPEALLNNYDRDLDKLIEVNSKSLEQIEDEYQEMIRKIAAELGEKPSISAIKLGIMDACASSIAYERRKA